MSVNTSIGVKIRHYNTVIKPHALYAAECIVSLGNKERIILCTILGPKIDRDDNHSQKSNKELNHNTPKPSDAIRRRRAGFFEMQRKWKKEDLLNKSYIIYFNNKKGSK